MQKPSFLAAPLSTAGPRADHVFGTLQYREDVRLRVCAGRPLPSNTGLVESKVKAAYSAKAAVLPENTPRNRYSNILPYDRTRVLLSTDSGRSAKDTYINASWIKEPVPLDSWSSPTRMWIASQAPLDETVHDFLSMFFTPPSSDEGYDLPEVKPPKVILMLTACVESRRTKSARYWPQRVGESLTFEHMVSASLLERNGMSGQRWDGGTLAPIIVTYISATPSPAFNEQQQRGWRTNRLRLSTISEGKERSTEVQHIEYLGWQDHGVPQDHLEILQLVSYVDDLVTAASAVSSSAITSPLVIHCSAGVGRTGSYIAVSQLMPMLQGLKQGKQDALQGLEKVHASSPLGPCPMPRSTHKSTLAKLVSHQSDTDHSTEGLNLSDPIMAVIDSLRDQRTTMVQTDSQIDFVYQCANAYWQTLR